MENVLLAFISAYIAIFPAVFCTIIPAIPLSIILDAVWQEKLRIVYANHTGQIFTDDMALAEMSAKHPLLYKARLVYRGVILISVVGIIWLVSFSIIYSLMLYLPLFLRL